MRRSLAILLLSILFYLPAHADLKPILVEVTPNSPNILLFARPHETAFETLQRYLDTTKNQIELSQFVTPFDIKNVKFRELPPEPEKIAILANNEQDILGQTGRMLNLHQSLANKHTLVMQIPVALEMSYTEIETKKIEEWINKNIKLLITPGGDDVDPVFYTEKNLHSRNTNNLRDYWEIRILSSYIQYKKGFVLGICRGHQLISSILGYKLVQDIPLQVGTKVAHSDHWHPITLRPTIHNFIAKILQIKATDNILVNSLHHQSVIYHPNGPLQLAAIAADRSTEALEFKNGHGLTLQFHPEYMNNSTGEKILSGVNDKATQVWSSCKTQFR